MPATTDTERVLSRATYAATPADRTEIQRRGVTAWLEAQLSPASIADPDGDAIAALYPTLTRTMASLQAEFDANSSSTLSPVSDLQAAHLGRAIWSSRQLLEVMVDFWSNHLNVPASTDDARTTRPDYDRTVIRQHALGRFEDLLVASAYHPAMLQYLDLANSSGTNPNENYARELLELHTVGVDGGYTEADIKQAAKLLSGVRLDYKTKDVTFDPARHYVGAITVMGWSHPNDVAKDGPMAAREFFEYLALHPRTAAFLAMKLARRFVSDTPPAALVTRLAQVYLDNDTAIAPVLKALFTSPEFATGSGQKLRRPMEHLAGVARAVGLGRPTGPQPLKDLNWLLNPSGHMPFAWPTPDGYADVAASWQSAGQALAQFGAATNLLHGWWPTGLGFVKLPSLLATPASATTPAAVTDQLCRRYFGRAASSAESAAAAALLAGPGVPKTLPASGYALEESIAQISLLLFSSPAFLTR